MNAITGTLGARHREDGSLVQNFVDILGQEYPKWSAVFLGCRPADQPADIARHIVDAARTRLPALIPYHTASMLDIGAEDPLTARKSLARPGIRIRPKIAAVVVGNIDDCRHLAREIRPNHWPHGLAWALIVTAELAGTPAYADLLAKCRNQVL